jgi:hypothetical protein
MVICASAGPRIGQLSIGIEYLCSAVFPGVERNKTKRNANKSLRHIAVTSSIEMQTGTLIIMSRFVRIL